MAILSQAKVSPRFKRSIPSATLLALVLGCQSTQIPEPNIHDKAHQPRTPYVDIAVNNGFERAHEVQSLYDSLASAGVRCGMRAMSCNAEQIVVERADFDRAKIIVTDIIIRDKLTVRVYTSPDPAKGLAFEIMEVWEQGQKVREEPYKLY
jgi:hypothetical protein